jgi:hypothetical protein
MYRINIFFSHHKANNPLLRYREKIEKLYSSWRRFETNIKMQVVPARKASKYSESFYQNNQLSAPQTACCLQPSSKVTILNACKAKFLVENVVPKGDCEVPFTYYISRWARNVVIQVWDAPRAYVLSLEVERPLPKLARGKHCMRPPSHLGSFWKCST